MSDKIEWMVEGADRQHHADRFAGRESGAVCGGGGVSHGNFLAPHGVRQFPDCQTNAIDRPRHFHPGIRQRLAPLPGNEQGEFASLGRHQVRQSRKNFCALVRGEPAVPVFKKHGSRLQIIFCVFSILQGNGFDR